MEIKKRFVIKANPDKRGVPKNFEVEKDRYETIICILSHKVWFIRVEVEEDGNRLLWIFDSRETHDIELKLLTGKEFSVIWQNVPPALAIWKDIYVALKDMRRNAK